MNLDVYKAAKLIIERNQDFYGRIHQLKKMKGFKNVSSTAAGRLSENQIINILKKIVPSKYRLVTGLIYKGGFISPQIDIIIVDKNRLKDEFKLEDLALVDHKNVAAAIEVKNCEKVDQDLLQMIKLKEFSNRLNLWIIWITFQFAQRDLEFKTKQALDKCKKCGVNGAIVGVYRNPRDIDSKPFVIKDPYPGYSHKKVYALNPHNAFGKFLNSMQHLKLIF